MFSMVACLAIRESVLQLYLHQTLKNTESVNGANLMRKLYDQHLRHLVCRTKKILEF